MTEHLDVQLAEPQRRAGEDLVVGLFADQSLDSPDHPLVDQASAFENPSIRRDQFSGRDQDHVGWLEIVDRDLDIDAIGSGVASRT